MRYTMRKFWIHRCSYEVSCDLDLGEGLAKLEEYNLKEYVFNRSNDTLTTIRQITSQPIPLKLVTNRTA